MKLLACHVANFGTLHEKDYTFNDGLNVVLEENGAGKSTLAAFVKAMLYGLTPSRKQNPDENERVRYMPWQGGAFGGWLSFETRGRAYRVERTFGARASADKFKLFDLKTGLESADYSRALGDEIFGVDAAAYERSVWHPQKAVSFSQNAGLTARLGGEEKSADMALYQSACEAIDKEKKIIDNAQHRGKLSNTRAQIETVREQIRACRAQLSQEKALRGDLERLDIALTQKSEELVCVRADCAQAASARERLARRETWQMLVARRDEARRVTENAAAVFPNGVPEEGQLSGAARLVQQARAARAQAADAMGLSKITRLAQLTERFPNGAPDADDLQKMLSAAKRADETAERVEQERARLVTSRAALGEGFESGVPNAEEAASALSAAEDALRRAQSQGLQDDAVRAQTKKLRTGLFAGAAVLILGGLVCLAVSTVATVVLLTLGASVAAGALFYLHRESQKLRSIDEAENEETGALLLRADEFLSRYELHDADKTAPRADRVRQVAQRAAQYTRLGAELSALDERARANDEVCARLEGTLARYGQGIENGYSASVMALSDAAAQFRALTGARDDSRRRMAEASAQARGLEEQIAAFFARYGADLHGDPDEILAEIRARAANYRARVDALRSAQVELKDYEQAQNITALLAAAEPDGMDLAALQKKESALSDEILRLESEKNVKKKQADDLSDAAERLALLEAQNAELTQSAESLSRDLSTLAAARDFLTRAYDSVRAGYLVLLRRGLRKYAQLVTGRDESRLDVDANFAVSAVDDGQSHGYAHFSRGQRDVLDICMRLALCDALFTDEEPFLVLDDPFANLDDENMTRARELLNTLAKERQILYLACHSSRA